MSSSIRTAAAAPYVSAALWSLAVLLMTAIHHVYGAALYQTPSRLHIVFVAIPVAMLIIFTLWWAWRRAGTRDGNAALAVALVAILGFVVAAIGLYEGGYNHLLSNLIAFLHGPEAVASVYGVGLHEVPNDVLFEATGIGQFVLALGAARAAWRLGRRTAMPGRLAGG